MKLAIQRPELDLATLTPIAKAALERKLVLDGFAFAPGPDDIARPEERFSPRERDELVDALGLGRSATVRATLDRLRAPGACAIVTGQQPGLLVAPLYNLYKALTAARLAQELERRWGTPVVALFWNHGDDHDIAEVHHAFVQNVNLDLQRVSLAGLSSGRLPFSKIVLDEEHHRLRAASEACVASLPHARKLPEALELLMPRVGETLSGAFSRALEGLVGHLGVVVFEPDAIRPQLSRALARLVASEPLAPLQAGADAQRRAGFEPTIDPREAALLYRVDERGRSALRAVDDGWRLDGVDAPIATAELVRAIENEPHAYSAGALLRPLVQDLALPAVAYVGGWGELGYHAELGALRVQAALPRTSFAPRASCALIDPDTREALAKLEVTAALVLADPKVLEKEDATPAPPIIARMREVGRSIEREINALREDLVPLDPGLAQSLKRTAHQARVLVDTAREKAERVHQNASGRGRRNLRRVANTLLPLGQPQERVLGPLDFVARFGRSWIDELCAAIDPFDPRMLLVELEEETTEEIRR
ncbi:MAG: bacillithiol biosynthesis cysteine-adding enzyme BshC [Planctomycetes bacterium]|nr:bacillithiol biosynthesis cysteine-adding enzyme BshC [Planctomycetota bacterium]